MMLDEAIHAAKQAGSAIMTYFGCDNAKLLMLKADGTPQTRADIEASQIIQYHLQNKTNIAVLSEESYQPPLTTRQQWRKYWLVDPLDGTKEFLRHKSEFVVSIALIEDNYPTMGVVYHPPSDCLYYAASGMGAYKKAGDATSHLLKTKRWDMINTVVYCSPQYRINVKASTQLPEMITSQAVGGALKFCYLAEGSGDVYPGFGKTCEWDIAAGHCLLEQAGGVLKTAQGDNYIYNLRQNLSTKPFWAVSDSRLLDYILGCYNQSQ